MTARAQGLALIDARRLAITKEWAHLAAADALDAAADELEMLAWTETLHLAEGVGDD